MSKQNLIGYTQAQLEDLMESIGEKRYKGRQLFKWLYSVRQYDFELMTDLTKGTRSLLSEKATFDVPQPDHIAESSDGSRKLLFELEDGSVIESVLLPTSDDTRRAICVSSQVGCALGCRFCATGGLGFKRNLTVGEILGQLIHVRDEYGDDAFTNIVMMGMGEPLLNLDNVVTAIRILSDPIGLGITARKVTISTAGVVPGIRKLAELKLKSCLAVSLNAATQEKRLELMPIAKSYHLNALMDALRYYTDATKMRVTFEYILIKDFNDTNADLKALARLVQGIPCKINLLAYNPVKGLNFERPSDESIDRFAHKLYPKVPAVTVRKSRGTDIAAACGQLAGLRIDGRI
jgi:23S rRNA (adenine2503-C2)-methyltransferase